MWYLQVLLIFGASLVSAEHHSLQYFYTGTTGMADFPQFIAVGILDGKQIDYYDSVIGKNVLKQAWMEGTRDENMITETRRGHQQTFSNNVKVAMERFNQTVGVHTFQHMYGCEWDDETEETSGFHQYGYDGEDFITMDLKELRYISPVQQGHITTQKWNNNKAQIESNKHYYSTICIEWLKKYLQYGKSSIEKTVSPQVSLLQKDPSSPVSCHATGFYPGGVTITWQKNGQDHDEDVDLGEQLPNEDGTFQKTSTLNVGPDERKNDQYSCVVEHQGKTVREILKDDSVPIGIIVGAVVAVLLLVIIGLVVFKVYQKKKDFKPVKASDDVSNDS